METLGEQELWSFFSNENFAKRVDSVTDVRKGVGHRVDSFFRLATKIAELQFRNPAHVLMFRGQSSDHRNLKNNTTLKPSLFRSVRGTRNPPDQATLTARFEELVRADAELKTRYKAARLLGWERLERHRILRWAILQHYEVCPTPLMDVTHSLRIAASFASQGAVDEAFLFVIAVPNLSGAITASAEAGLQIVRLSSVCPPSAVRPHIQEGYLLGEYPDMEDFNQKELYPHYEIDFGRRLVAKFRFDPKRFWKSDKFPIVDPEALYPSRRRDRLCDLTEEIKEVLKANRTGPLA